MSDSTNRPEGVSITIKTGKGYEDSWLGFTGSVTSVKQNLIDTFGLTDQEDLTLYEVVANATQVAHGVTRAVTALKGTVVPAAPKTDEAQQQSGNDPWAGVDQPKQEVNPYDALLAQIDGDNINVDSLRRLYADNTELFTADTDEARAAKAAWKAKGKALQQKG